MSRRKYEHLIREVAQSYDIKILIALAAIEAAHEVSGALNSIAVAIREHTESEERHHKELTDALNRGASTEDDPPTAGKMK